MANYKIKIKQSAVKELYKLPQQVLTKILKKIEDLEGNPRPKGVIKLTNRELYRIRYGNYRILYTIDDDALIIQIVKIGHRRDIYR